MITTLAAPTAELIRDRSFALDSLDPAGPLDDLEPLRELVGDVRVVAIGESGHHVREFYRLRHRLARFLVERMGFDVYALEAPFTAVRPIDDWVQGAGDDAGDIARLADDAIPFDMGRPAELADLLRWLRRHNQATTTPVTFAGTDVPGSGGSPRPALVAVRAYLVDADRDALPLADRALELVDRFDAPGFGPMARYAQLDTGLRDELTAILSRLLARLETTAAHQARQGRAHAHGTALHDLRGAWHLDHFFRDLAGSGIEATGGTSRDRYIAETALRLLDEGGPERRVILAAHNWHIQRTPVPHGEGEPLLPAGFHLAEALGDDFVSIAATAGTGTTAQLELDPADPTGYRLTARELPPPTDGSVETAFERDDGVRIADLRPARRSRDGAAFERLRMEHYFIDAPVAEAFDAVAHVDAIRVADGVPVRPPAI
jgi:erythromycin esterase